MATNLQVSNRESLLLPDRITPYDNLDLPPPPDASWLLSGVEDVTATPVGRKGRTNNRDINLQEDFDNSKFLQGPDGFDDDAIAPMDDLDLDLGLGDFDDGFSMEMGRDAPAARGLDEDLGSEFELAGGKPGDASTMLDNIQILDGEGDLTMGDGNEFNFHAGDRSDMPEMSAVGQPNRARISESPLSDIDEQFAKDMEAHYGNSTDLYEPADETETTMVRRPAQRPRRQKVLMPDDEIALSNSLIKQQQANRENITKPARYVPRDPVMLALMDMHKSGGFVSSIMMDGRSSAWAPELRGMLTLDMLQGELKRKRDSGVADVDSDQGAAKSPRLEFEDPDMSFGNNNFANQSGAVDGTVLDIPDMDDLDEGISGLPDFEDSTMPIVHPADSGPVSLGTKHAVHILRDLFGADAATDAEKRTKSTVVFQDLLPEKRTTKAEATKMFFECLVLATKDAIKVDQGPGLGDNIRVRGKRGLWGDWAEREAGGEIAQSENESAPPAAQAVAVGA